MSIRATITTDANGDITVQMHGGLEYDYSVPLKEDLLELAEQNPHSRITLDMQGVDFVGSSGIGNFVDTLRHLNRDKTQVNLQNVKEEFVKVFKLYTFDISTYINDQFETDETRHLQLIHGGSSRRTFEN
ncbi:MAG: STAS domain-containing protein [Bacteriovoracaceae bacterium]|nr:STAS domain-containing protein [Bacteriovoracaceae bacterium]